MYAALVLWYCGPATEADIVKGRRGADLALTVQHKLNPYTILQPESTGREPMIRSVVDKA